MPRFVPLFMLLVLLFGLVLMRESRESPGSDIEEGFVNWLAANTERHAPNAPLALVEINDSSLSSDYPWPWTPLEYATFLDTVLQFQPGVIAIEPVLQWDEKKLPPDAQLRLPQYEKILHDRILLAPKILLGAMLGFPEDPDVVPPVQAVPVLRQITGSTKEIPEFTTVDRQPKEELRLASTLGFVNVPIGRGPVRRAPMLFSYRGQIVPSFVLQALMLWMKLTPDDVKVEIGSHISLGDKIKVPIDAAGGMLVDFKAPFARISFEDLPWAAQQAEKRHAPVIPLDAIQDKLVLLARTDANSHVINFPIRDKGSSGELFAAAIATLQNGMFIRRVGFSADAITIGVAMLLSWFLSRRTRKFTIAFIFTALASYVLIGLGLFAARLIALPVILPVGLAFLLVLFRLFTPDEPKPNVLTTS